MTSLATAGEGDRISLRFLAAAGLPDAATLERLQSHGMKLIKRDEQHLRGDVYFDTPGLGLRAGLCQPEKAAPRGKRSEAIRRLPQLFV